MCLILLAVNVHPDFKLVLAANRDEFYDRPSEPPHFWKDTPDLLAGRDLVAGGSWLGVTRKGRIGAITNYRDPASIKPKAPSRGKLLTDFLIGDLDPMSYLDRVRRDKDDYNGFNLLLGSCDRLTWYSNRVDKVIPLAQGIYGLSNHLLDTPWPKLVKAKARFKEILDAGNRPSPESLFQLLKDQSGAPDKDLPNTGMPLEWERILSPIFIKSPAYGTRSSTIVLVSREGHLTFLDRTFNGSPKPVFSSAFHFALEPSD